MRPTSENLKRELRALVKEAVWFAFTNHTPGAKPDICLFCTRRGGSTMVMEAIAANRGVKFLDQPLEVTTQTLTAAQSRLMPKVDAGELVSVDDVGEQRLRALLSDIFDGRLPVNAPWRFWRRDFDFRTDRLVLKIVGAKALIDWFDQSFDVDIVYVTRHPIPQALSCIRNSWSLTARAYLRNESFVAANLDDAVLARCWDILRRGAPLEQFVLNWALENLVPLRLLPSRPEWSFVSYEATVLDPATLLRLGETLRLDDTEAMLRAVARPSRSSRWSTEAARGTIAAGDRRALLESWRRHVTAEEERSSMAVLELLGIDLYVPGEIEPRLLERLAGPRPQGTAR